VLAAISGIDRGTGQYLPFLLEKGHSIFGFDQSQGMLEISEAKFPKEGNGKIWYYHILVQKERRTKYDSP
jgi:ubiquinone/menaquinone biosynthesis C-methylase UbiE